MPCASRFRRRSPRRRRLASTLPCSASGKGSADVASAGYPALIATQFSGTDENDADRMGPELMARAGYDSRAGLPCGRR
jgi:predicted Zn-dependent protease